MEKKNIITVAGIILIGIIAAWLIISGGDSQNNQANNQNKSATPQENDVVATINDQEITGKQYQELQSQIASQQGVDPNTLSEQDQQMFKDQIIQALVSQELIKQQAQEAGITVSNEQIDQELESIKQQFQNEEEFNNILESEGLTEEEVRINISDGLLSQAYIEQELDFSAITATEAEIESAYEAVAQYTEEVPALEDVYEQVEQTVIQQKQQELVSKLIEELRGEAEIEILI